MDLSFDVTRDDYVAWADHWSRTDVVCAQMRSGRVALSLAGLALAVLLALAACDPVLRVGGAVAGVLAALVWWIVYPTSWRKAVSRQTQRMVDGSTPALFGGRRYSVDEQGLRFSSLYGGGYLYWTGIDHVEVGTDGIYVYVAMNSAHIVPRRAFGDDAAFQEAWQRIWGWAHDAGRA